MTIPKQSALLLWAVILHFALFSFNALATSTTAALIGTKWEALATQEKFMIFVAVAANWTGLILVYLQRGISRIQSGKLPVPNGDTEHIAKP